MYNTQERATLNFCTTRFEPQALQDLSEQQTEAATAAALQRELEEARQAFATASAALASKKVCAYLRGVGVGLAEVKKACVTLRGRVRRFHLRSTVSSFFARPTHVLHFPPTLPCYPSFGRTHAGCAARARGVAYVAHTSPTLLPTLPYYPSFGGTHAGCAARVRGVAYVAHTSPTLPGPPFTSFGRAQAAQREREESLSADNVRLGLELESVNKELQGVSGQLEATNAGLERGNAEMERMSNELADVCERADALQVWERVQGCGAEAAGPEGPSKMDSCGGEWPSGHVRACVYMLQAWKPSAGVLGHGRMPKAH